MEVSASEIMTPVAQAYIIATASFSKATCLVSGPWCILAKKVPGCPFCVNVPLRANSDAYVSTVNGMVSSIEVTAVPMISSIRFSNSLAASLEKGNNLGLDNHLILSENQKTQWK